VHHTSWTHGIIFFLWTKFQIHHFQFDGGSLDDPQVLEFFLQGNFFNCPLWIRLKLCTLVPPTPPTYPLRGIFCKLDFRNFMTFWNFWNPQIPKLQIEIFLNFRAKHGFQCFNRKDHSILTIFHPRCVPASLIVWPVEVTQVRRKSSSVFFTDNF